MHLGFRYGDLRCLQYTVYIYIFLIGDLIPGMPESEGFRGTELGNGEDGWVFSRNKND